MGTTCHSSLHEPKQAKRPQDRCQESEEDQRDGVHWRKWGRRVRDNKRYAAAPPSLAIRPSLPVAPRRFNNPHGKRALAGGDLFISEDDFLRYIQVAEIRSRSCCIVGAIGGLHT